jgi:hypothetical protein
MSINDPNFTVQNSLSYGEEGRRRQTEVAKGSQIILCMLYDGICNFLRDSHTRSQRTLQCCDFTGKDVLSHETESSSPDNMTQGYPKMESDVGAYSSHTRGLQLGNRLILLWPPPTTPLSTTPTTASNTHYRAMSDGSRLARTHPPAKLVLLTFHMAQVAAVLVQCVERCRVSFSTVTDLLWTF